MGLEFVDTYSPTAGGRVSSMGFVNPLRSIEFRQPSTVEFRQLDREARMVRAHTLISDLSLTTSPYGSGSRGSALADYHTT